MDIEQEEIEKEKKLKRTLIIAVGILAILIIALSIRHQIELAEQPTPQDKEIESLKQFQRAGWVLSPCENAMLGVTYVCNAKWEQMTTQNRAVIYQIETFPTVWFKIVKFDIDFQYIDQLSTDRLSQIGQYAQGFAIEDVEIAGFEAIKVKAFAKNNLHTRMLDFYFVRDKKMLYALMFSVNPASQWDDYKFLFQSVAESFAFKEPLK